ncbi:MAG: BrnT family toxin [Methyloprofundus sp.]|nr:BrnT family toxin [Methyloprofundus sp.]
MYEWNEEKNKKIFIERGLSFADAKIVFSGTHATFEDTRFDYGEQRFITFGMLEDRMVVIAHTPRGEKTRIISMRKANYREQKIYKERLEAS